MPGAHFFCGYFPISDVWLPRTIIDSAFAPCKAVVLQGDEVIWDPDLKLWALDVMVPIVVGQGGAGPRQRLQGFLS